MAYDNRGFVKDKIVKAALDDFEFARMLHRMKRAGYPDRSKYIRDLILKDIQAEETVKQSAHA